MIMKFILINLNRERLRQWTPINTNDIRVFFQINNDQLSIKSQKKERGCIDTYTD